MWVMDTVQAQPLTWEYERVTWLLERLLNWFGFNPNRVLTDAQKTATAIALEEENQSEVIQQIQEGNTRSCEFAVKITMDMIVKNISDDDDTPLPIEFIEEENRKLEAEEWKKELPELTLWQLKKMIENYQWNIVVNSRTWLSWSNFMQKQFLRSAVNDTLALWDVETAKKLIKQLNRINWVVISDNAQAVEPTQWPTAEQEWPWLAVEWWEAEALALEQPL